MKKVISVLLSVVMIFSVTALGLSAFAVDEEYPTIYIEGQGMSLIATDGTELYPNDRSKLMGFFEQEKLKSLIKDLLLDQDKYCAELTAELISILGTSKLDKNGEASDGSDLYEENRWKKGDDVNKMFRYESGIGTSYPVYRWHYDWRLSPLDLGEQLNDLINAVIEKTGKPKVNIISRCLGTNIAYAYLAKYGAEGKVNKCVMYAAAVDGLGVLDAVFTGDVVIDSGSLDRFLNYFATDRDLVIGDGETTEFVLAMVALLNQVKVLGVGTQAFTVLFNALKSRILPQVLRESYATYPSYWAMTGYDSIEKAKKFIFKDYEEEYAGLIEKIDAYAEIQKNSDEVLKSLSGDIDFMVISKYGLPGMPVSADSAYESDTFVSVTRSAFGAKCSTIDSQLSSSYIKKLGENKKYVNVEKTIDASTCLFPDTTWFIKDLGHVFFPDCVNDLIFAFFETDGMTVWNTKYTQYMQYRNEEGVGESITAIVNNGDTSTANRFVTDRFKALYDFIIGLLRMFKKLINR